MTSSGSAYRVALVTGAGRGIGRAIATRLASDGYAVVCADIDDETGAAVAESLGSGGHLASFVQADVADPAAVEAMVAAVVDRHGGIDVLVNNVGVGRSGRVHELALDDWQLVVDTTLSSVFYAAKYTIPHMLERDRGAIVNIASVQGLVAHRRSAAYNAAKAGVINLTRNIALDYATDGIRCNCICPGAIESRSLAGRAEAMAARKIEYPEARTIEEVEAMHPLGRIGTPEEIAAVAAFLASDESSFMTGAAVVADGGLTTQVLA